MYAGGQQQQRAAGRPRGQWAAEAKAAFINKYNTGQLVEKAIHSTEQCVWKCNCCCPKHVQKKQCSTVARSAPTFPCKVCTAGNKAASRYAREVYSMCDASTAILAWAAEVHAMQGTICVQGLGRNLGKKAWDVLTIDPPGILIEVQGEQHSSKLNTMPNNTHSSWASVAGFDAQCAQAAVRAGYTVVWLQLREGESDTHRRLRWKALIEKAIQQRQGNNEASFYS